MASPMWRVPDCTSTVATAPRPLSSRASTVAPRASISGLARRSSSASAVSSTASSSLSTLVPCFAEMSTNMVLPPYSSGTRPYSVSWPRTLSGLAPGLSILLTATTIGTCAAWAWLMASTVCGMTPSSAATTRIATSVSSAPRARIAVKASWPGVSRNVILRGSPSRLTVTWYAPMRWVMPPASPSMTLVRRMVSSSRVLPWSTWPMTVTTGGRGFNPRPPAVPLRPG